MSELRIEADGDRARIVLDDQDISHRLMGLKINLQPEEPAGVELDVKVVRLSGQLNEATYWIPADTADLLVTLGWKPPEALGRNEVRHVPARPLATEGEAS